MNVLVDELPETLEVDGKEYKIKSDYRYSLSSILAFEDAELSTYEKVMIMLQNLYNEIPENIEEALKQGQYFLNAGQLESDNIDKKRLYSFSHDANLIYAAFQATHGINLTSEKMHWWRFLSLFMDLGQDTTFCQLVSLRKRYNENKLTKEEKAMVRELGDTFKVPDNKVYTLEELETIDKIKQNYQKARENRNA